MESVNANTVTMFTVFLTFVTVFTPSVAAREYTKHGSLSSDAGLLLNLMKRLGNDYNAYPSEKPEDAASRTSNSQSSGTGQQHSSCGPVSQSGVIIKATESMKAGADYIDSIKGVRSNSDCAEYCCRNATCDVAVYQDKEDRYCYLFNCHGKCQFKSHSNYFVNTMMMHPRLAEQSEEDLQNLSEDEQEDSSQDVGGPPVDLNENVNPAIDSNQPTVVEETSPKSFMPVSTQAPEPFIAPHSVGLQGYCSQDIHCEDPNAGCVDNNCLCKGSYYDKEGVCRKVCPPSNFECFELGTLSRGPECVPRSQVCDSYLQCADGSDEFNCDSVAPNNQQQNWSPSYGPAWSGTDNNNDKKDSYTQPVVQEPAGDKQPQQPPVQASAPQNPIQPGVSGVNNNGGIIPNQNPNIPAQQTNNVRPNALPEPAQNPPPQQPVQSSMENSMSMNANNIPHPGPRPSPGAAFSQNVPANPNYNPPQINPANTNTNYANPNLVKPSPSSVGGPEMPVNRPGAINQQFPNSQVASVDYNPKTYSAPVQSSQGQQPQSNMNPNSRPISQPLDSQIAQQGTVYSEGSQYKQYPNTAAMEESRNKQPIHPQPQAPQVVNNQGTQPAQNSASSSRTSDSDGGHSGGQSSSQPQKLVVPSSALLPHKGSSSKGSGSTASKSKPSSSQGSSGQGRKSSQSYMSRPTYSNSQKWLDPNLYLPYGMGDSTSRQQAQQPMGNQYYDSSQYYPPYSSDSLDTLPESLLGNTGSADEFSQFGGPYLGRDKSLNMPYSSGNQASNFLGYPDLPYAGQYPSSNRYDYNGEYRSSYQQDPDFYSPVSSQQSYRPSAGAYEDFPTGVRLPKPSTGTKDQGSHGTSGHDLTKPHTQDDGDTAKDAKQPASPSKPSAETSSNKTKSSNITSSPNKTNTAATTPKAPTGTQGEKKHFFVSSEKVIIASSTSNAEGPIIALSLGLVFTLILLVLVGCRLRNMRQRLRKGRPLHQNEADYLINGMYL